MKFILSLVLLFVSINLIAQISIEDARNVEDGEMVTIEGIILNGSEGGQLRYIQDESAGIALFDGLSGSVSLQSLESGDRVVIEGEKTVYQGLVELNKINSVDYISPNNTLPTPKLIGFDEIGEKYQSERILLKCANINSSFTFFNEGTYEISDQSNTIKSNIIIAETSNVVGSNIPNNKVEITAINSFQNEGRLLLLNQEDLTEKECLGFTTLPKPTVIQKSQVTFEWNLSEDANQDIYFGDDPEDMYLYDQLFEESNISFNYEGLQPGLVYYTQIIANNGQDEVISNIIPFVTQSNSTGEIEVYFNNDVDASFSDGSSPNGTTAGEFDSRLFQLFDNAKESIDIAMYNINRTIIVNYLIDAYNRGVEIRYIADDQTNNNAFEDVTPPFGLVYGSEGSPLMHNKFVIIDANQAEDAKVIMGSTNFTSNQMSTDPNHMLVIHDQSLARAYTMEFQEMWGSSTHIPDINMAKFGSEKEDNTPHFFNINGIRVESYFSPSDRLTDKIEKEIRRSSKSIDMGLLTFTKNELGFAVKEQYDADLDIRIILENFDDNGSEYSYLKNAGIEIKTHNFNPIYHHKLAIFDEGEEDAAVLTGSHNWTNKAEFENDENTLIIRDQSIANIFLQEYEARWEQLPTSILEEKYEISIYPNPASHFLYLSTTEELSAYSLYNIHGQLLSTDTNPDNLIDIQSLRTGSYIIEFEINQQKIRKLIIKK